MTAIIVAAFAVATTSAFADPMAELEALQQRVGALESTEQARQLASDADALASTLEQVRADEPAARALRFSGVALMNAEEHGEAVIRFQRSAALCRAARDEACLGRALNNAGVALQSGERMGEALRSLRLAADAFARAGEAELSATTRFNAANIQLALGDPAGALSAYLELERAWPKGNFALGLLTNQAQALAELSRFSEADAVAKKALTLADDPVAREGYLANMRIVNLMTRARAAAGTGERAAAFGLIADAERIADGQDRDAFNIALGCLQVHSALRSLKDATLCAATVDRLRNLEDEGTRTEALALAARSFASAGDAARAFDMQSAAFEALASSRRAALAEASAMATAEVGIAERTTLIEQISLERATERENSERFRLLAAMLVGGLIVASGAALFWLWREQTRRRATAIAEDRMRVARDLHDTALQGFAGAAMQLEGVARQASGVGEAALAEKLGVVARELRTSLAQVRDAVWQLRSSRASTDDFARALAAWLVERREAKPAITTGINLGLTRLDARQSEAILRVIQEAVANAANHGRANQVSINVNASDGAISLDIVDDGVGFSPTEAAALGGRWGLLGMRERVEALGGTLNIDSAPGAGTRIAVKIPA